MRIQKLNRKVVIAILMVGLLGVGIILYVYFQPHRDVQSTRTDYAYAAGEIVNEYLANSETANQKYLDEHGDSKVIEVNGIISEIQENYNGDLVVVLSDVKAPAGVSCTFVKNSKVKMESLHQGEKLVVKGVIRSGASYDADLEMYENVVLEECDLVD